METAGSVPLVIGCRHARTSKPTPRGCPLARSRRHPTTPGSPHASSRGVAGVRRPMLRPVVSPRCAAPCFVPWCRRGARPGVSSRGVAEARRPVCRPDSGGFGVVATVLCRPLGREGDPQVALDAGQPLTRVGETAAQLCVVLVDEVASLLPALRPRQPQTPPPTRRATAMSAPSSPSLAPVFLAQALRRSPPRSRPRAGRAERA